MNLSDGVHSVHFELYKIVSPVYKNPKKNPRFMTGGWACCLCCCFLFLLPSSLSPKSASTFHCFPSSTTVNKDDSLPTGGEDLISHNAMIVRSRLANWTKHTYLSLQARGISTWTARSLLDLPTDPLQTVTLKEIREAYFVAAKKCHPDMKGDGCHDEFLKLTTAYEVLQAQVDTSNRSHMEAISESEENLFRAACQQQLGVAAEIVEECKKNPIFRRWLGGNTDAAHTWRDFFVQNGGLAPKLRPVTGWLGAGENAKIPMERRRRRR